MLQIPAKTALAAWFDKNERSKSDFASVVGCTPGRITQICSGETPSLKLALAIEAETKGEVTCSALLQSAPSKEGEAA